MRRLRLVLRLTRSKRPLSAFMWTSIGVHVALALAVILFPAFSRSSTDFDDAMQVALVASVPATAPPAAKATPEPEPEPEPPPPPQPKPKPEQAHVVDEIPEVDPDAKQEPEPEPETTSSPQHSETAVGPAGDAQAAIGAVDFAGLQSNWYRNTVISSLSQSWIRPVLSDDMERAVTVAFEIQRDGRITNPRVESSSGIPALDRSALRAVVDATLPPLPRSWREPTIPARFVFRLTPGEN